MSPTKTYLGDGVYADFDGYCLVLTTEDGVSAQNIIVLEPGVYRALTQMRAPTAETRLVELEQELNDVFDALGIAGVGEPISLWQAAQSLMERATAAKARVAELERERDEANRG